MSSFTQIDTMGISGKVVKDLPIKKAQCPYCYNGEITQHICERCFKQVLK